MGTFVSIITLCLLAMLFPVLAYIVVVLIYLLAITTLTSFSVSTYLMVKQINKMIDDFFRNYERQH